LSDPLNDREKAAQLGEVIGQRRGRAVPSGQTGGGLTIAVGTSPQGLSLANEARLAKAALLYADQVVLYSPSAVLLASAEQLGHLDVDGLIAFIRQVAPALGEQKMVEACDLFEQVRRKRHKSRDEILAIGRFKTIAQEAASGFATAAETMLAEAGAAELQPALDAGVLRLDPLLTPDSSDFAEAYLGKLGELLAQPDVHLVFDDETGDLVRAGVAEGLFEVSAGAERRGKQAAAATGFIGRMPALPRASMEQVLDVREELREPLGRFRPAVIRLARLIEGGMLSDDFAEEVQDIYDSEVAPALEDIAGAFTRDAYLRELLGAAFDDVKTLLACGAGLVAGIANPAHLPALASDALGVGAAAIPIASKALYRVKAGRDAARQDHLYFLYRANQELRR
jgi:hypothetical protein